MTDQEIGINTKKAIDVLMQIAEDHSVPAHTRLSAAATILNANAPRGLNASE